MSIEDVTRELVRDMEQNETLQQEGRSVHLHSISPFPSANGQQQRERDWLVTVPQRDGSVIFMVFVAPLAEFDRFRPAYEAMLKNVSF